MSAIHVSRYVLACDGCGTKHGEPDGHSSAMEMRAAAYNDGWRFPPVARKDGHEGSRTSDVCPNCLPDWTPQGVAARHTVRLQDGTEKLHKDQ